MTATASFEPPMPAVSEEPVQRPDAADILKISVGHLDRLRYRGEGPDYIKLGRRILYFRSDLLAWARERRQT